MSTHHRILQVRTCFPFETEGFSKVESDHRVAGVFEKKVAKGSDGDLLSDCYLLFWSEIFSAGFDFLKRFFDQLVDQIVGLDPQSLAPRDFHIGFLRSSSDNSMPSSEQQAGDKATIS